MALKKNAPKAKTNRQAQAVSPTLFHRIQGLLHTMRCIGQYEDELCTLLHAAQNQNALDDGLEDELRELLAKLPAEDYTHEIDSLREALPAGSKKPRKARAVKKKAAVKVVAKKKVAKRR